MHDLYSWLAPKPNSKKRRVFNRFLAARGGWVTGSELHAAFGERGWAWDGALAQLRAKLRERGGDILSQSIDGRDEYRYRLVLPSQVLLRPQLERTEGLLKGYRKRRAAISGNARVAVAAGEQEELF